jgi:hypothetical protein
MVGLGIGAALAVSLVLATGASAALPELGRCVKQKHGEYTTGSCTTKAAKKGAGFFEWEPGAVANGFSIKGGLTTFEAEVSGTKFACKASSGAGEYVGSSEVKITKLAFTGCEVHSAKVPCQTEAAEGNSTEGEINFYALDGVWGKIKETKAGILLTGTVADPFEPPLGPTPFLAHWECGGKLSGKGVNIFVEEGVIAEVTATDVMSLAAKEKFAKSATGKQAITEFEGEAEEHELVDHAFASALPETEPMNAVMTLAITNTEKVELKAK